MKIKYLALFCVALILSGCGSAPKTKPAAGVRATLTIAEPILSPSHPPLPQPTQSHPSDPEPIFTSDAPTNPPTHENCGYAAAFISPDGNWTAQGCNYYEKDAKLVITQKDGREWSFMYADYILPETDGGEKPFGGIDPEYWSPDSRYLFFSSALGWDGGGTCFYGFGRQGLFRWDTKTSKISTVLPLLSSNNADGYVIRFSPTGRRFAYTQGKTDFHIIDLLTGQDSTIQTDNPNGSLRWSPDGLSLAFSTSKCDYENQKVIHSVIKVLKIDNLSVKTVAQSEQEFLEADRWESNSLLIVNSINESINYHITIISIDLNQNKIIATAIATP